MSRSKECNARPRGSRIPSGLRVRFVAFLVRFTGKTAQSTTRFPQDRRDAGGNDAKASVRGPSAMEKDARMSVRVPRFRLSIRPIGHPDDESRQRFRSTLELRIEQYRG